MEKLRDIIFKNEFVESFDGDHSGNLKPRQTPGVLYCNAMPTPVKQVSLLGWSEELASELGIERPVDQQDIDILGGNHVNPSMKPYAACYAGHQFGNWAGQLGDGRAITLAELQAPDSRNWELQLKGAGLTPYSRSADGRAVLRSSVREYLMSEAMYYLNVPTTRALSLVTTGDRVLRDMFYNGNAEYEAGAIVMRVAPSFLRFGNFQILAARREEDHLRQLVDWTISRYYPHITGENKVLDWYKEVVDRTASLMVDWLRVGFVHGVMNTDNMSILGLTIDYGPYSFVDNYDWDFTPNTTDLPGKRYAFGKQSAVGKWNLACLAAALATIIEDKDQLQAALETYDDAYWGRFYLMMGNKLGLDEVGEGDIALINQVEKLLKVLQPDMTIFFQLLIELDENTGTTNSYKEHFKESFYTELKDKQELLLQDTMTKYVERIQQNETPRDERVKVMRAANPRLILRNYLLQEAIDALDNGDASVFHKLEQAIKEPYSNHFDEYFKKRPDWATQKAGCSMLSCSS